MNGPPKGMCRLIAGLDCAERSLAQCCLLKTVELRLLRKGERFGTLFMVSIRAVQIALRLNGHSAHNLPRCLIGMEAAAARFCKMKLNFRSNSSGFNGHLLYKG
jgi:hypothetical protein